MDLRMCMERRSQLAALIGLAVLLLAGAAPAAASPQGADDVRRYARPAELVEVEPGRRINLLCAGRGSPTVILEAGAGDSTAVWRKVQSEVAKRTRVCAYDRAGYGFSDPSPHPSDARQAVRDLKALLARKRIGSPVVLVGHSLGGLYSELFAATYPDLVAGLVLVDPTGLDDFELVRQIITPDERQTQRTNFLKRLERYQRCLDLARNGQLKADETNDCATSNTGEVALDEALQRQRSTAGYWAAYQSEMSNFFPTEHPVGSDSVITRQVREQPMRLGDKPLVIMLSPGRVPPGERGERLRAGSKAAAERLAATSSRGRLLQIESGHYIQLERPEAVARAIVDVVDAARAPRAER